MKKMLKRLNSKKGFTLAELLIVVAIIAVLVAVSIPVFNSQLEKAREATDAANLRAAYAEQTAALLTWDGTSTIADIDVETKQSNKAWETAPDIGGVSVTSSGPWKVSVNTTDSKVVITGSGSGSGGADPTNQ